MYKPTVIYKNWTTIIKFGFVILLTLLTILFCNNITTQNNKPNGAIVNEYKGLVTGELRKWHKITLTFTGSNTSEKSNSNPFRDYRLNVTFTHGDKSYTVPGYYAADGNAAETSADQGDKWRVNFMPNEVGEWNYKVSFRQGKWSAISDRSDVGKAVAFDGTKGSFLVQETDKTGSDFRGKGLLSYVNSHYLQFAETGEYFLKGGANSPENFLAYYEFDGTLPNKHRYEPHRQDWQVGDPTWQTDKGKNIIGALNYLAGKGMNSVYFLTMNVKGDGEDVFPWISPQNRDRFDCSKLDQWEVVFSHMDRLGLMLHVVTQEQENDQLLNWGRLGKQRKLYYRELIARFGHHPALIWNLGEENTNSDRQRRDFIDYFHQHDSYHHPLVVHTYPWEQEKIYQPLLDNPDFTGASLQMRTEKKVHKRTKQWVDASTQAGHKWIVSSDEFGPADVGVKPDSQDYWHDTVRQEALWGNLMANGMGSEWYFGHKFAHNDLTCEDWRSREHMWELTNYALEFFRNYLPFWEMTHNDKLASKRNAYVLAKVGEVYAIYLKKGHSTSLQIPEGKYIVQWYNPRQGGQLQQGSVTSISGAGAKSIGEPPQEPNKDWAILVKRDHS